MEKLKEALGIVLAAAVLIALFFVSDRDWQTVQKSFIEKKKASADSSGGIIDEKMISAEAEFLRSLDSLGIGYDKALDSLSTLLEYSRMFESLDAMEDSLDRMEKQLDDVRNYLVDLRVRIMEEADDGLPAKSRTDYFTAVRYLDRIASRRKSVAGIAQNIKNDARVYKRLMDSEAQKETFPGAGERTENTIHWLVPENVPVREACTSCHLPAGDSRVMLNPDDDTGKEYPTVMLKHSPDKFGCTVCHNGNPSKLSYVKSHARDRLGRPFLGGTSAYMKCGLCHSDLDQIAELQFERVSMPAECVVCHAGEDWSHSMPDSLVGSESALKGDDTDIRKWLLAHWVENTGVVPARDDLESTLVVLIAGGKPAKKEAGAEDSLEQGHKLPEGNTLVCPRCRRTFIRGGSLGERQMRCPLDGQLLVEPD